jgi:hypothetical protein
MNDRAALSNPTKTATTHISAAEMDKVPDLQELAARYGGYNKITPAGWTQWDRANAEYQATRREILANELAALRKRGTP